MDDYIGRFTVGNIEKKEISLPKFIQLNYDLMKEMTDNNLSKLKQSEMVSIFLERVVSKEALSVALSRYKHSIKERVDGQFIIINNNRKSRFVNKDAVLTLGGQTEIIQTVKRNGTIKQEEKVIDWRGLHYRETVSSWVKEYQNQLIIINKNGWRWVQIAAAVSNHLNIKINKDTLTALITIYKNK